MINILFNPKIWIKIIKNPSDGYKKIIKILSDYPRLQNFIKIKNKKIRLLLINFYVYLVSKNRNLKFYFLDNSKKVEKINFSRTEFTDNPNLIFESLSYNGIVIINNIIENDEKNKILSYFEELEKNKISSEWINNNIINASNIKYGDSKEILITCMHKNPVYLPTLNKINQFITKNIFGKPVDTFAEFFIHASINDEKVGQYEDTIFHVDRYLPCLKIIYSPNKILDTDAPFGFIKKSHKLNKKYMRDFLLNTTNVYLKDENLENNILNDEIKASCMDNSLIIAFTNGFHKRNIFLKKNYLRKTVFFQFTKKFNRFSLFNYNKYN